jgi:hypothetical protein
MRSILIVDDDRPICFVIDAWLGRHGLKSQPPIAIRRASSPRRAACARSSGKIFGKILGQDLGAGDMARTDRRMSGGRQVLSQTGCCPAAVIEGAIRTKRLKA